MTTVYSPEVLLLDCMDWMFTFGSESFGCPRWQSSRTNTYDNQRGCPKNPNTATETDAPVYLWLLIKGLKAPCVVLATSSVME